MNENDTRALNTDGSYDPSNKPRHIPKERLTPKAVLILFEKSSQSIQFDLVDRAVLGRRSDSGEQPDIDLAPFGAFPGGVSRLHARLHRTQDNDVLLEDLNSRNGTYLDGELLKSGEIVHVRNGQALKLAGLQGWIYFEGIK